MAGPRYGLLGPQPSYGLLGEAPQPRGLLDMPEMIGGWQPDEASRSHAGPMLDYLQRFIKAGVVGKDPSEMGGLESALNFGANYAMPQMGMMKVAKPAALPMDEASRLARADQMGFRRDMPLEGPSVPADEVLLTPAIRIGDRVFSGKSHGDAVAEAHRSGIPEDEILGAMADNLWSDGYVTNAGRFVPRETATEIGTRQGLGDFGVTGLNSELALPVAGPAVAVARIGATPPEFLGGQGIWSRLSSDQPAIGEARWHRAERPGSFDATGLRQEDIQATLESAFRSGHDAVKIKNYTTPGGKTETVIVVKDPSQLRSPKAKFDPAKIGSPDIMAGLAGLTAAAGGAAALAGNGRPAIQDQVY